MGIFEDVKGMEGANLGDGKFSGIPEDWKKEGKGKNGDAQKETREGGFETLGGIETMRDGRFEIFKNWPGTRVFPLLIFLP